MNILLHRGCITDLFIDSVSYEFKYINDTVYPATISSPGVIRIWMTSSSMLGKTLEMMLVMYYDHFYKRKHLFNMTIEPAGFGFSEKPKIIFAFYIPSTVTSFKLPTYTPASGTYEYTVTIPTNDLFSTSYDASVHELKFSSMTAALIGTSIPSYKLAACDTSNGKFIYPFSAD